METILVILIVGAAAAYAVRNFYKSTKKSGGCGCSGCSACDSGKKNCENIA